MSSLFVVLCFIEGYVSERMISFHKDFEKGRATVPDINKVGS